MTHSKLATQVQTLAKHYTKGRAATIKYIVLHHNASTSPGNPYRAWQTREASAHYQIEHGRIISHVEEENTAWHCGGPSTKSGVTNSNSIGIEHLNATGAPGWTVAADTEETSARLVADIARRYGIPIDRAHIKGHGEVQATACPGGFHLDEVVKRAAQIATGSTTPASAASAPVAKPATSAVAKLNVDGACGAETVKRWQQVMGTFVDGVISGQVAATYRPNLYSVSLGSGGSNLIRAVQKACGITADGFMGPVTVKAIQKRLGVNEIRAGQVIFGPVTVKALQTRLNSGKF
ncbi:N-acetylmuramoyl-L-alanine amidase [Bifidobacterium sp.]|uniref:N-acetylmuramoyl-L-alanine amidase n=1 Tax=Bifidobacterium sp. TaxID=41200 RepID=UPI0039ED324F